MRWAPSLLLSAVLLTIASAAQDPRGDTIDEDTEEVPKPTVFDDQTVPPIVDLSGPTLSKDIAHGYWLVEAFSPYCTHCTSLAPKWQTLYEFYYTSNPVPTANIPADSKTSLNSFSKYYNLKYGKLDCVAFGTACGDLGVSSFPTIILFKDGVAVPGKKNSGDWPMKHMSDFTEECLEAIRPGSRPRGGVEIPEVGAKSRAGLATPEMTTGDVVAKKPTNPYVDPDTPPNANGTSRHLDLESFDWLVTKTLDPWFIKFYAPWCHHCQAMAPSWAQMAKEMQGRLNIGEVNCDVQKRLCKDHGVNSYPTIKLFKGPERIDYEGLRGLGDMLGFAQQTVTAANGVPWVSAERFKKLEETEEVIFTYFYDHATASEDFQALERLPIHVLGRAIVVKTDDEDLVKRFKITTWPRLIVSRDGKIAAFPGLMPQHIRDVPKLVQWMQNNWLPLVPELSATNAHEIMDGKFVVLGILNREREDEFAVARREIKNAAIEWMDKQSQAFELEREELRDAKQLRIDEAEDRRDQRALRDAKLIRINMDEIQRKDVTFAWVDGVFWERWLRTTFGISVNDGERVIMYDLDNHKYWENTITGNPIVPSRTSILETLPKVVANPPKLTPKATGSSISHFFFRLHHALTGNPIIAAGLSIALLVGAFIARRVMRRQRLASSNGGFFQVGEKEGLLGTTQPNGKVD